MYPEKGELKKGAAKKHAPSPRIEDFPNQIKNSCLDTIPVSKQLYICYSIIFAFSPTKSITLFVRSVTL